MKNEVEELHALLVRLLALQKRVHDVVQATQDLIRDKRDAVAIPGSTANCLAAAGQRLLDHVYECLFLAPQAVPQLLEQPEALPEMTAQMLAARQQNAQMFAMSGANPLVTTRSVPEFMTDDVADRIQVLVIEAEGELQVSVARASGGPR